MNKPSLPIPRRVFLAGATSLTGTIVLSQNVEPSSDFEKENAVPVVSRRNISSFRMLDWRPYFKTLRNLFILYFFSSWCIDFLY